MSTIAPEVLWAQRSNETDPEKNVVYLTINAPNLPPQPETKLELTPGGIKLEAQVKEDKAKGIEGKTYAFQLDFFDEIDVENSKQTQNAKHIYLILRKSKAEAEFWPRLSKDKVKLHFVKTDFNKWVDEDEQDGEDPAAGGAPGGMDDGMMGGFGGGGGGMGGMDPAAMMGGMGGGGGEMDLQKMLAQMGGMASGAGGLDFGGDDEEDDDEEEGDEEAGAGAEVSEVGAAEEKAGEAAPPVESKLKDVESVD
ncbi:unnamed protein product [Tilletia laevis]|uniref:CS domain-containing protein n=2 Tax=Tilletia TaxID=13289 RepID=A0A177UJJ0_9BASI|nr:hypothetical protein CF336_g6635 [Tilletia laevis]KAE8253033.1 hypothetical protein A4X03_0g6005 [Tilletia caries]CAD6901268.1 unnamed protein product [Tilletia controversa]KAE8192078.1 hypothetical protein CF335_g5927 [Tilletia laevis]CAD6892035.1 unnamed protein product [Tilletia caries]